MKKILPMILVLAFSLPVFAKEVKLSCTTHKVGSSETSIMTISFDEAAGTVNGHKTGKTCGKSDCSEFVQFIISESDFGHIQLSSDNGVDSTVVSRVDGSIEIKSSKFKNNNQVGTCIPFKQAF